MTRQELFNELATKVTAERSIGAVVLDEVLQLRAENKQLKDVIAKCEWALENCGQAQGSDDMDDGTFCRIDLVEEALAAIKEIEE